MAISTTYNPSALSARSGQGSAIGNREDLSGVVPILEAKQTPFYSLAGKTKATATYHEWLIDKLDDPENTAINEGADVSSFDDKHRKVARVGNRTQHFRKSWLVSKEQEAVNKAGAHDVAGAITKSLIEHKRDIEKALLGTQDLAVEDGTTANTMRGLGDWIDSAGPSDVAADYRTPAASILSAAPTEITFNDVIGSMFNVSGDTGSYIALCGITVRKAITQFTRTDNNASEGVYNLNQDATGKRFTLAVNVFDSDFGLVTIANGNPRCMPSASTAYILNPAYAKVATLLPTGTTRLEDQGGGPRGFVNTMLTLEVCDPRAHGKIVY